MRRRAFLASATGAALSPAAAGAQPAAAPTVGMLMLGMRDDPEYGARLKAFRDGLAAAGWIDGKSVHVDVRWAEGAASNIDRLAASLVAMKPPVIVANGTPAVVALKKATSTVPIVCALVQDPVRLGLVASLGRPGGNVTGFTYIDPEMIGKWRQLLADVAPATKRAAMLFDPTINPQLGDFVRDLTPGGISIVAAPVRTLDELKSVMAELGRAGDGAVIEPPDNFVLSHRKEIAALAQQYRLPNVAVSRQSALDGSLMSYGPDTADIFRRAAGYVDRILRGAKPAEMPVQQPDKFEFVLNLGAAKALGLTFPSVLLARADEVIE